MNHELSFGQWVKQRRKSLYLTQQDLAERTGCALSTIQKIEIGARLPSHQIVQLLAEHLELAPDERNAFLSLARPRSSSQPIALAGPVPAQDPVNNLPAPLTSLIGREWEVATLRALLARDDVRLLTISGPPGIGKTRLAIHTARAMAQDFADGVCFVPLAQVNDDGFLLAAIIRALGVVVLGRMPLIDQLKLCLAKKHMLLVLDNFEHLVKAGPLVADLLEAAPYSKAMVTSRALLQLYGEHEFVTPPLALPDPKHLPPPADLASYAAIELFVQRARAARIDFGLTDQNANAIAQLCLRLDGLPLAIELAAARCKQLSPEMLLARLGNRSDDREGHFSVLTSTARNLSARQQTLQGAIEWSYRLLTPSEQRVFRYLGVFGGGCTLEALADIIKRTWFSASDNQQFVQDWLLNTLHALVNQSLVVATTTNDGSTRFSLLELIRDYALQQLLQSGEIDRVHQAHAEYFLAMAETTDIASKTIVGGDVWAPLLNDQDNLRAALRWTMKHDADTGLALANALTDYWGVSLGFYSEARHWLERGLALAKPEPTRRYASAAKSLGAIAWQQGDLADAQHWLDESVACWRVIGDERELGIALQFLALISYDHYAYERAQVQAQEAVSLLRARQDPTWLAIALSALGITLSALGEFATAREVLEECKALFVQQGNEWGVALALLGLVDFPYMEGDFAKARRYMEEALRIYFKLNNHWFAMQTHWYLGKILWHLGDSTQAVAHWEECAELSRMVGAKDYEAVAELHLGFAALREGERAIARRHFLQSLTRSQQVVHGPGIGYALCGLAALITTPDLAATILGASSCMLVHRRPLLDGLERSHYERIVASVRKQLDERVFAEAWARGQVLPVAQSVELAHALLTG